MLTAISPATQSMRGLGLDFSSAIRATPLPYAEGFEKSFVREVYRLRKSPEVQNLRDFSDSAYRFLGLSNSPFLEEGGPLDSVREDVSTYIEVRRKVIEQLPYWQEIRDEARGDIDLRQLGRLVLDEFGAIGSGAGIGALAGGRDGAMFGAVVGFAACMANLHARGFGRPSLNDVFEGQKIEREIEAGRRFDYRMENYLSTRGHLITD